MKKVITIFIIIICFYTLWLAGVPILAQKIKPILINAIEKEFGYKIIEDNLYINTGFLPYYYLKADKIKIKNPLDNEIIKLVSPQIKVSALPLFIGKVHVNNVKINKCNADIYIDEKIFKDKKSLKYLKNITLNSNYIDIKEFNFKIAQAQNEQGLIISGENLSFSNNKNVKNIKLNAAIRAGNYNSTIKTNIYIPQKQNISSPSSDIEINNLDLKYFNGYFNKYLPQDITSVIGIIDFNAHNKKFNLQLKDIAILFKNSSKSIILPNDVNIKSDFNISEDIINLSNAQLISDDINAKADIKVSNYNSKHPHVYINTCLDESKTASIIKALPALNSPDIHLGYLKKYPLHADASGNLLITGTFPEPDITGDIIIKNGYIIKPIPNDNTKATIKLVFKNKSVSYDVLAGAGGKEQVTVKGETKLYGNKISQMEIKSSDRVDLRTAKSIVDPLHDILYFETGPVPIMELDGKGNIDIKVSGNHASPHVWGKMNFYDANASFNELKGLVLTNTYGVINFDDQNVNFKTTKAFLDGKNAQIQGRCNLFGKTEINFFAKDFNLQKGLNAIKTSPMLKDIKSILPPINNIKGSADFNLDITGDIPDINKIELNKNLFVKGSLNLKNVIAGVNDFCITNINGLINFSGTDVDIKATSKINNSIININGDIKNNLANIKASSQNLNLDDILHNSALKGLTDNNYITFNGSYKGKLNNIEYDKINLDAHISKPNRTSPIAFSSGSIYVKNGTCTINKLKGTITQNPFEMEGKITHLGRKNQNINASIKLNNASLSTINLIREFYLIPNDTKELLRKLDFKTGKTNINFKIVNNYPYTNIVLNDVEANYIPLNMPLKIINGGIELKNNRVYVDKMNTLADDMPIFLNGSISNIYKKPDLNIYLNSVPKQTFIDKYINKNMLYPLKVKGDIIYSANIKGPLDNYNITANAKIGEKASVYYLGATLGDGENQTILEFDGDIIKNSSIKINNFAYNKSVLSQNNKSNLINFLKMSGQVRLINNEPHFNNLLIKTENPTDARIFNIIFKKPNIKQGLFTSDLRINGKLSDLKILGDFHIFDINVPLLQTVLKDITLKFQPTTIKISSKGEIFSNEISLVADAENRLRPPFKIRNGLLHFKKLDFNSAIKDLKQLEINKPKQASSNNKPITDLTALIIERLDLKADDVLIKGVSAKNLKTVISLSDKMNFSLSNYNAEIANGYLSGDFSYNLLSNRTSLILNAEDIDANNLSEMLFDLSNQMYGSLRGTATLSCNGSSNKACMSTVQGSVAFNVSDGKMPKLGSLEYLLKAGNLIKGGITDLSINSIIDLVTPLKTGEFSNIYGNIKINNGIAEDIKILTRGENLNLYVKGNYNLSTSNAHMYVFGLLSKNIKTPLGAIGNMSLNTLFNLIPGVTLDEKSPFINDINKIPGIELSKNNYRKFIAEIIGDISGDNYVKSFEWIN